MADVQVKGQLLQLGGVAAIVGTHKVKQLLGVGEARKSA